MDTQEKMMKAQIEQLLQAIKDDYRNWHVQLATSKSFGGQVNDEMIADFNDNLFTETGRKYIRVVSGGNGQLTVWGFIVHADNDKKFRQGDILKAAGWKAPARNAARGNILDGGYDIKWTGPLYL